MAATKYARAFACALLIVAAARPAAAQTESGVRNFGAWLDDATLMPPGQGYASVGIGYFRLPLFREVDFPSMDGGLGLTRRVQIGASVPVYHATATDGPLARGFGDFYLSSKIQLRDPAADARHHLGFALVPIVEVLSAEPVLGAGRVNWALPVTVEWQHTGWRMYGSTGYFSRGSLFASAAFEYPLSDHAWLTGTISESQSVKTDDLAAELGLAKARTDVSGSAAYALPNGVAFYGSVGRTISKQDANSTNMFLTGGVSFAFTAWTPKEKNPKNPKNPAEPRRTK